jgi:ABC-type branched-subunit amino acid transport system ATPase component
VRFDGQTVDGMAAHQRTILGLARSFQLPRPFHSMSVADNLRIPLLYAVKARAGVHLTTTELNDHCVEYLRLVGLDHKAKKFPRDLTRSRCASSSLRAMAAEPKLLIADESTVGLSHSRRGHPPAPDGAQRARHHHHPDRAHYERGDELLAAAGGAGIGKDRSPTAIRRTWYATLRWRKPTLADSIAIRGVHAGHGAVRVLEDVTLDVRPSETAAVLLGTNGNGKSTLMKCIMGMARPSAGTIWRRSTARPTPGRTLHRRDRRPRHRAGAEGRRLFPKLTVEENLLLGAFRPTAGRDGAQSRFCYDMFDRLKEPPPARRFDERRRAADAGDCARADERAAHPAGGRTLGRPAPILVSRTIDTIKTLQQKYDSPC